MRVVFHSKRLSIGANRDYLRKYTLKIFQPQQVAIEPTFLKLDMKVTHVITMPGIVVRFLPVMKY
jgi:hypothetical protein